MHEYSIIESLLARVDEEARARNALGVHRLTVQIGALSGVEPELLARAYETFREGTVCATAELEIENVKEDWACPACAKPVAPGAGLSCTTCGVPARLVSGDEIILKRIEMEVA